MDEPESSTEGRTTDVDPIDLSPWPIEYITIHLNSDGSFKRRDPKFEKGTTSLAFTFEEGIMVAADYSCNSPLKNVVELNSHMIATISGGSESLLQLLLNKCREQERKDSSNTPVAQVLKWMAEILSAQKQIWSVGILIAVWNQLDRGIYRMNGSGELLQADILSTGSGSSDAYGIVEDELLKFAPSCNTHPFNLRRPHKINMSISEAKNLVISAICEASFSAPQSGDTFCVYYLGSRGCERILEGDLEEWQNDIITGPRLKYKIIGKGWSEA